MNLLLVAQDELTPVNGSRHVLLDDRRAEHLVRVLGVEPDRELRAGMVGGGIGTARVLRVDGTRRAPRVELALTLPGTPPQRPDIDLIVALPRPQALHRILQTTATMGVGRLALVNAWRVEKSFFSTPSLAPEKVRRHLLLGAEQGVTTWLPEVRLERLLVPFVRDLGANPSATTLRLIAHPDAETPIEDAFMGYAWPGRVELAIGPEGGWIDREVQTFGEEGFRPVSLGTRILRVETAVTGALAQLNLLRRQADRPADRHSVCSDGALA